MLVGLRRIMRAIDLRSKQLEKQVGLTVPQLLVLQQLHGAGELSVNEIARGVNLSQGTVTAMLLRLESKGILTRNKREDDRRKSSICLTKKGIDQLLAAPELLQKEFISKFDELESWEQKMLVSAVERIAALMDIETVDASPILEAGDIIKSNTDSEPNDP